MRCGFEERKVWAGIVIGVFGGSEGSDAEEAFGGCIEEKVRSPAGPVEAECLGREPGRHSLFLLYISIKGKKKGCMAQWSIDCVDRDRDELLDKIIHVKSSQARKGLAQKLVLYCNFCLASVKYRLAGLSVAGDNF